jgi:hypothetical protein
MKNGLTWLFLLFGKQKAEDASKAWKSVFNSEDQAVIFVLKDLANYCNFNKSSFVPKDKEQTFFNEGARDVYLHILEMANLDVNEVIELSKKI